MAGAARRVCCVRAVCARRGYGEDGVYVDHRSDCRDSGLQKTCSGRWRGVVSLGFDADGKRIRGKVSGKSHIRSTREWP